MRQQRPLRARSNRTVAGLLAIALTMIAASCGSSSGDTSTVTDDTDDVVSTEVVSDATEIDEADTDTEAADVADDADVAPEADAPEADAPEADDAEEAETDDPAPSVSGEGVNLALFFDGALADTATVDCTLSGGAEATCYSLTVAGFPTSYDVGPFCPSTIEDGAESGGLWFDGETLYDLDGQFFVDLPEIYGDDAWQMYDEDGNILVTETAEEFEAAARPDVDESLQNHCVEGALEWLDNGEPITSTVVIPMVPVAADSASTVQGNLGVTLDGVVIAASAPAAAILGAYTIAAFDDCGAHFNPNDGYHLHGAVGCSEVGDDVEGDAPQFGYAMDGYPVHSPLDDADAAAAGLDECNGHTTDEAGYHYHANNAAENQVIECLVGQTVSTGDAGGGGGGGGDRPDGPPQGGEG